MDRLYVVLVSKFSVRKVDISHDRQVTAQIVESVGSLRLIAEDGYLPRGIFCPIKNWRYYDKHEDSLFKADYTNERHELLRGSLCTTCTTSESMPLPESRNSICTLLSC